MYMTSMLLLGLSATFVSSVKVEKLPRVVAWYFGCHGEVLLY